MEAATFCERFAVTVAPERVEGAKARQISAFPSCALARPTNTQVSPAPVTLLTFAPREIASVLTKANRSSLDEVVENAPVVMEVTAADESLKAVASVATLPQAKAVNSHTATATREQSFIAVNPFKLTGICLGGLRHWLLKGNGRPFRHNCMGQVQFPAQIYSGQNQGKQALNCRTHAKLCRQDESFFIICPFLVHTTGFCPMMLHSVFICVICGLVLAFSASSAFISGLTVFCLISQNEVFLTARPFQAAAPLSSKVAKHPRVFALKRRNQL
jgi:hypothetical protein